MAVNRQLLMFFAIGVMGLPMGASASLSNLVTNGSFETGSFGGWTVTGTSPGPVVINDGTQYGDVISPDPFTFSPTAAGTHQAYFVDDGATEVLTQSVSLISGTHYEVGFDLFPTRTGAANPGAYSLSGSFGSQIVASVDSGALAIPTATWTHFSGLYAAMTTGPVDFNFVFNSANGQAKDVVVDDVYARAVMATPEPTLFALMGAGLIGLALSRKR